MQIFNYFSVFTLIDTDSVSSFAKHVAGQDVAASFDWIWEFGILIAIGVATTAIGSIKFIKKDLPL